MARPSGRRVTMARYRGRCRTAVHRNWASIALAIAASKPEPVIRKSYAAYFTGMIRRHAAGALNLERSLWKLRRDSWKGTRH